MKLLSKYITLAVALTFCFGFVQPSSAEEPQATVCYRGNTGFVIAPPPHWVNLRETAAQFGLCVLYVPEGYDFDNAPAVIYPNLTARRAGPDPVAAQVEESLAKLRAAPGGEGVAVKDGGDFSSEAGLDYKLQFFDNGPESNRFELVAFHEADEDLLMLVLSSYTVGGRTASLQEFMSMLFDIFPIEVTEKMKSGGK